MITLELSSIHGILYLAYFRQDYDLQVMLARVMAVANFTPEPGNYLLKATYKDGKHAEFYTNQPTANMHYLLSDYKKVFNIAYKIAQGKIWPFAWLVGGEGYRIKCALLQMVAAREALTDAKWGALE